MWVCNLPSRSFILSIRSLTYNWTLANSMLAVLFIVGTLCPLSFAALDISLLDPQLVLTPIFQDGFLLRFPNCSIYGSERAFVLYNNTDKINTTSFIVPTCNETKVAQGFHLGNLQSGTLYSLQYNIAKDTSSILNTSTTSVTNFDQINDGLPARSGAMVVITVLLVLAMVVLLSGLIFLLFFSG